MLSKGNIVVLKNNKLSVIEVELSDDKTDPISYESIRDNVGGDIEIFAFNQRLADNKIQCWCDENGKVKNLPISMVVCGDHNQVIETINGDVVFTGGTHEGGSFPLNQRQIDVIYDTLALIAHIKDGAGTERSVRLLRFDVYKDKQRHVDDSPKKVIEIKKCTDKSRECNICTKHKDDLEKVEVRLGRENYSTSICLCNECLNAFAEKIWEYLAEVQD